MHFLFLELSNSDLLPHVLQLHATQRKGTIERRLVPTCECDLCSKSLLSVPCVCVCVCKVPQSSRFTAACWRERESTVELLYSFYFSSLSSFFCFQKKKGEKKKRAHTRARARANSTQLNSLTDSHPPVSRERARAVRRKSRGRQERAPAL